MGRRSRKRDADPVRAPSPPAAAPPPRPAQRRPVRRHARLDEAPKAPWHPLPLVELSIFAGLVLIVVALASDPGEPRTTLLFGGLALISVASLELAVREHLAGYRSHTTLLAGAAAMLVAVPLWFTPVPQPVILVVALGVGLVAFRALRTVFERRAEGMSWRA
ncbi:MAG TPA: hypothetical protein VGW75_11370 [Solirubrobacteraceae bacterium]|jgi:uncharacterized membrane protein HdeD (DUF308 family)|nr:hypothetical protein [Solirubrobacteraceae bacterium]